MRYVLASLAVFVLAFAASVPHPVERISLALSPSAQRAYALGMSHFSSQNSAAYDIESAEYFLKQSERMDGTYPYVHHQLARVYFLTARYPEALQEINEEIRNDPAKQRASAFYMRGLIEGYLQRYDEAVADYEQYVALEPDRWEGRVDLAWVLIKTGKIDAALRDIDAGLERNPENPWLLSVKATALFEAGKLDEALKTAYRAQEAVETIDKSAWLKAYPGNDPKAADSGIATLRTSAQKNVEMIRQAIDARDRRI